jgi:uncharacterized protein YkwD
MRLSLRIPVLAVSLLLAATFFAALAASSADASGRGCRAAKAVPSKLSKHQASKAMLCLINRERRSHGLRNLDRQGEQTKAARKHTRLMIRSTCFSHQCPGEGELVSRMQHANYLPCGCYWGVGENLAYGERSYGTPKSIMHAWMNSSEHRANILNGAYEHVGIGIVWGTPEHGFARGSATYTTDFGYRR